MNELMGKTGKMTSLQIAEITGKDHAHLMRDIRKMEEAWYNVTGQLFDLSCSVKKNNKLESIFYFTKTESLYIATKCDAKGVQQILTIINFIDNYFKYESYYIKTGGSHE